MQKSSPRAQMSAAHPVSRRIHFDSFRRKTDFTNFGSRDGPRFSFSRRLYQDELETGRKGNEKNRHFAVNYAVSSVRI